MTYEEAVRLLTEALTFEFHIISAWESSDSFLFTVYEDGDEDPFFDLDTYKLGKDDVVPQVLEPGSEELTREYLENAKQVA